MKILLIIFLSLNIYANQILWQTELEDAKDLAKTFNKPIMLFLESRKCYYCPIMKEQTFTNQNIINMINKDFIPLILDNSLGAESDVEGVGNAPERLTTSMTPAIYFMGPNEEKLNKKGEKHMIIYGLWKPNELQDWLKEAKRKFKKLYGKKYVQFK